LRLEVRSGDIRSGAGHGDRWCAQATTEVAVPSSILKSLKP